mmetsp:Transcript_17480/g.42013  ORF Transcript_17480/g.42013 Transcript_17480/m.42013 type:complete len:92 (-) Transcript_17480:469-744(-)
MSKKTMMNVCLILKMTIEKKAIKDTPVKLEDERANRPLLSGLTMFVPLQYHYLFRPERQSNIISTNNVHIEKRRGNNDDRHQYYINNRPLQ